jgi:hypothetical protein
MIQPISHILSRTPKEELNSLSSLLDDTINFGTHLLHWDIEQNTQHKENIVFQMFFKNILEIGDAISILVYNSSIINTKSLIRVLIENMLSLEYLLEKDSRNRALAYIVANTHKEIERCDKMDSDTEAGKQYKAQLMKDKVFEKAPFINIPDCKKQKEGHLRSLQFPDLKEVEEEYQNTHAKKKNPYWYALYDGPKNVEQLAKHLKHHALYETFYRGYSENIHSGSILKDSIIENKDGLHFGVMRETQDAKYVTLDTLNLLAMAYFNFAEKRLPQKKDIFDKWNDDFNKKFYELKG